MLVGILFVIGFCPVPLSKHPKADRDCHRWIVDFVARLGVDRRGKRRFIHMRALVRCHQADQPRRVIGRGSFILTGIGDFPLLG